jgi:HEAT repeat protein
VDGADQPSTGELVRPLLVYGFTSWVGVAVLETTATATLVSVLGATKIPAVNLVGAALAAVLGLGYAAIHRAGRDGSRPLGIVVALVAGAAVGLALGLSAGNTAVLVFLGLVLYRLAKIVMPLALWDAAGDRLEIGQGKRLFGVIGATQPLGRVTAYVSVPLLVGVIGTTGLFGVAAGALVIAAISLHWARQPVAGAPEQAPAAAMKDADAGGRAPIGEVLRGRMVMPMLALAAATTACYTILSFSFSLAGGQRFHTANSLASAVAIVSATSAVLAALASAAAARGLLRRFGVAGAVAMRGLAVAAGGVVLALVAGANATTTVIFVTVAALRILEDVTSSLTEPATRLLGRVLPPARRAVANAAVDGEVGPAALALASLVIVVLVTAGADTFAVLGVLIATVAAGGAATAWSISRDYREVLREALAERRIDADATELDPDTVREIERVMATGPAPVVSYALDLLAAADAETYPEQLIELVGHPVEQVRLDVLDRIEALDLVEAVPAIRARLPAEGAPAVRRVSARVVAALSEPDDLDDVLPYLTARDPAVRRGAMAGLLRSGDIEAILAAGEPLLALIRSPEPDRRREAAVVLGEGGRSGLYRPLRSLLDDPDPAVVDEALRAAAAIGHPRVWPLVVDQLRRPEVRSTAQRALERGGGAAREAVARALPGAMADERADVAVALLRALGQMGPAAVPVLEGVLPAALDHPDRRVGDAATASLLRLGHRATGPMAAALETDLERGVAVYARVLNEEDGLLTAGRDEATDGLVPGLVDLLQRRRRRLLAGLLDRWAVLQDAEIAHRATTVLGRRGPLPASPEDRSYVIESLETGPHRRVGQVIAAAVSGDSAGLRTTLASTAAIDLREAARPARLLTLAGRVDPVLAGFALQLGADDREPDLDHLLDLTADLRHPFVTATADELRARRHPSPRERPMMTPVERMLALKSSELLAQADDDLLAEILDQVVDRAVEPGDVLFLEGAPPERLVLVLSGMVELTRSAGEPRSVGPGEPAGELAVLDTSPYTATAVVRQAGTVIELPASAVELLLASEPTFSRELLRRVARRARLAETGRGAVDDTMASILDRLVDGEAR